MNSITSCKPEIRTSEAFDDPSADVVFQSCDGVQLRIHRKNLETSTGGFAPAEFDTYGEVVHLTESARTLELLFHFIYPRRHPSLECEVMETLAPLAEAVEKYEVFPAINICHVRMTNYVQQHPIEVMGYAGRHGYSDLLDQAAPLAITKPLKVILEGLPPALMNPWVHFYEAWDSALRRICMFDDPNPWPCNPCTCLVASSRHIYRRLGEGPRALASIYDIFLSHSSCSSCGPVLLAWFKFAQQELAKIPKFSTFL